MKKVFALAVAATLFAALPALAKGKKAKSGSAPQASAQTARAIGELAGKFRWDMSAEQVMKVVLDEVSEKWDEQIQKEKIPAKQQVLLKQRSEALAKLKTGYVKFEGKKTGWDVSLIDHEFVQKNDESMYVIWENSQRRFLFFHNDRLWKQFIAFNAENPIFAGKTFDDFADIIQRRYGPASITFKKKRTSDEQAFDHLEWPPAGDYLLWAIDLTTLYGNFCLSLIKRSAVAEIERSRNEHNPKGPRGSAIVDQITKGDTTSGDANADVVDEITGRGAMRTNQGGAVSNDDQQPAKATPNKKKAKPEKEEDPLDGMKF